MITGRFNTLIVLLIGLVVFSPHPASARHDGEGYAQVKSSILDNIVKRGVIRVGTTGDFKPFSYMVESDPLKFDGVDVRFAQDLASALDVKLQFVQTSWPALMDDLLADKFDIAMSGITIKLERQKHALFSLPVMVSGKAPITRDENAHKYTSISKINTTGTRVIVNPGGTNEAFARANFPNAEIIVNKDNLTVFERIVSGEADVMVTDAAETLIQEKIHPDLEAVNPEKPLNSFEFGYMMPRDHTLKAFIDQWLRMRRNEGTYRDLFNRVLKEISDQVVNAK